ncbi:uncharacterized protein EI90DRAFT_3131693 [Cantharellus anzutake]|uniref:uncharacterized protein n=1 Tax=Cantharellus anzutake TaxID=1750568 RepID=UPI001904CADC|nr:uncharacterized protein EI90DRAFT_3131693 [Cantharellus anzutake]KAF8321434.1 hypothetical protein EI90DRAFT_3131693 [Cantharellus anzutake]
MYVNVPEVGTEEVTFFSHFPLQGLQSQIGPVSTRAHFVPREGPSAGRYSRAPSTLDASLTVPHVIPPLPGHLAERARETKPPDCCQRTGRKALWKRGHPPAASLVTADAQDNRDETTHPRFCQGRVRGRGGPGVASGAEDLTGGGSGMRTGSPDVGRRSLAT